MTAAPIVKNINDLTTYRISAEDTVKLTHLTGPSDGSPTSVFFEIWEPLGRQPDNSHPDSVEIFIVLNGTARATSDDHTVDLHAGDVLVLPEGSVHHIQNASDVDRLYTVTIMANDSGAMEKGFESLVMNGTPEPLTDADKLALLPALTSR
ncbi:cupin domain-containing protein [uncultured Microbacterium sp.]|uniref:cupin domain-containing protein n=1 Tax=uncultured Microbacterium sp. TaxID=191216 RepID=UPI0035CA2293